MSVTTLLDRMEDRDWERPASGTVRYALIGLGWWSVDVAIPAIADGEYATTTVLVSSSSEKAARIADEHGIGTGISYDEYHAGVASDEYDAVYIGTPNALHRPYAETAASLEKAILCEKPIAARTEQAAAMVATCEEAGVPFMPAYRMHFDPAVRRARAALRDGVIGEPRMVYGNNSQPLLEMIPDENQWRLDADRSGYGTSVMDLGIYTVYTTRFLLDRDPIRASADMRSVDPAFEDVPDQWAAYMLTLEDDVLVVGTTSQDAHADSILRITGTEGTLELSPAHHGDVDVTIRRGDRHASFDTDSIDVEAEMRELFDYFANRVLRDEPVEPSGRDALVDMRTIEATHEAAREESSVPVEDR